MKKHFVRRFALKKRSLRLGRLSRLLVCVCLVALTALTFALASETPSASTVISSMTTGLTTAQGNIISMINSVVPIGVGVYAVTAAVRVGKRMFKISGGNGN